MNDLMSESWTVTGLGGNIDSPTSPLTLEKLPIRVYSGAGHYRNQGGGSLQLINFTYEY
jgi:hypothetical protein